MSGSRIVFLLGFMGSGKSTVGIRLGDRLGFAFVDLDEEIERRAGVGIARIFDDEGEDGFRDRETEALRAVTRQDSIVVATGGGVVIREENRRLMDDLGVTVWIDPPFDLIARRVDRQAGTERPLFVDREQARQLFEERRALYSRARLRVEVGPTDSVEDVADRVARRFLELPCAT